MRWLAIDHGTKRIGLAVGSDADDIATPLDVIDAEPLEQAIAAIARLAGEYDVQGLVVGWPLNMDDSEGPQAVLTRQLALQLRDATGMDTRLWDERLSSFQADQALAGQFTRKKKKARQDAVAAAFILQGFFSSNGPEAAPRPEEITDGGS